MAEAAQHLRPVLNDYANFLRGRELSPPEHHPRLVRWVREFLLFARRHGDYTPEKTWDILLAEVRQQVAVIREIQEFLAHRSLETTTSRHNHVLGRGQGFDDVVHVRYGADL